MHAYRWSLACFAVAFFALSAIASSSYAAPVAPPAPAPAPAPAPTPTTTGEHQATERVKTTSIGVELGYLVPIGAFSKFSGPSLGPLVRGGYRVAPRIELTARSGFLYGLSAGSGLRAPPPSTFDAAARVSTVPIWLGARAFLMDSEEGLYASIESGLNIVLPHSRDMRLRWGANGGFGYVFDKAVPIDLRAELAVMNLFEDIPRDSGLERTYVGLAMSLGYTF